MNFKRLFPATKLFNIITQQTRSFVREPFPNKVIHYLHRAKLIDSIRLALRSSSLQSVTALISHRLVDNFIVTHALRSAPSAESALFIVDSLKSNLHFSHNQDTIDALATVLAKFRQTAALKSLIDDINAGMFGKVRVSFMNLMNWYANSGDFESVLATWDEYRCSQKDVCTESYNTVMDIYLRIGKNFEAVEIFCRMIEEGSVPNSRTYTVMIEHLLRSEKLDSAMEVFNMLPLIRIKRTLKQYSVLVEIFTIARRFREVKTLLDEMKAEGKFPSQSMLLSLQHMQEAGFVQETDECLRKMLPDGRIKSITGYCVDRGDEDEDQYTEDNVNSGDVDVAGVKLKPWLDPKALANAVKDWNHDAVSALEEATLVWTSRLVCKVLRNFNSPETAWNFFCWVACQPGFTHDAYTVQRMMTLLACHGHVELVDKLISKVRSEGMRLPLSTIRLIIDFYGISKKADAAMKVFVDDRTLCGHMSRFNQMLLYTSLLRTLTKCGRNSDALDMLNEMILNGIIPDIQTFSGLMYHFALQGDIKTVQKIFALARQNGIEPDGFMFKILIQGYCKCERAALAWRVFEEMKSSNLMPDAATKELLVNSLWKEGKRREAAAVEESEERNSILPLTLHGHIWTVSSADLTRIYNIYASSFTSTSS